MKAMIFGTSLLTALLLTACGGDKEHIRAVDSLEKAEATAKEKAPTAEPIQFDDHGKPTIGGVGGATGGTTAPATPATETATTTEATAESTDTAPAETPTETKEAQPETAPAEATAEASADK